MDVVAAYIDQRGREPIHGGQSSVADIAAERAAEFGFSLYPTISEALRCGGEKIAVDAVLMTCEHVGGFVQ